MEISKQQFMKIIGAKTEHQYRTANIHPDFPKIKKAQGRFFYLESEAITFKKIIDEDGFVFNDTDFFYPQPQMTKLAKQFLKRANISISEEEDAD